MPLSADSHFRKTSQLLAPAEVRTSGKQQYEIYPAHPVAAGEMVVGMDSLAELLRSEKTLRIDGFVGVFWEVLLAQLEESLDHLGVSATSLSVDAALIPSKTIEEQISPSLGGNDPLFGKKIELELHDFFDQTLLAKLQPSDQHDLTILYGSGAALVDWDGPLIYADLPKNELQFRSRAGSVCNLFTEEKLAPKAQYKRFYFVDWPILARHKQGILEKIDWFVDAQRPQEPVLAKSATICEALRQLSENVFRVRPWFEPGPWGGQWLKRQIADLPQDVPNYAWSFELIVPENGLMFTDGTYSLELSFDWLMFAHAREVLGESYDRFGVEFPIRFDFLDTVDGGNLSVQCHPRPEYIQSHFGESFTQDECYYMLDCEPNSRVYLGFNEGVDPAEFRAKLEKSFQDATEVDVKKYVNTEPATKHDLFLIPNGTIHCSGSGNLVLEISATPYIFTFKMYDWLRLDLEGRPRPLNIDRAFENLYFERQGPRVKQELVSKPQILCSTNDYCLVHLPTHPEHFYDVQRWEFDHEITDTTEGSPHVLMLVEGTRIKIVTQNGKESIYNFAETFVVPAAAESYRLINLGPERAFVVKAYLKHSSTT